MTSKELYVYEGGQVFDDVVYTNLQTHSELTGIKEEFVYDTSDIVIATYPKSGTTWTEELVYSILVGLEKSKTRTQTMDEIFPFIETTFPGMSSNYERLRSTPSPRTIKTHLGVPFFRRQLEGHSPCPKFIVTFRNPKDTLVSFYNFHKMFPGLSFDEVTFSDFFRLFAAGRLYYGNGIDYSVGWWKYRHHPNVLVLFYEDMLRDSNEAVQEIATFLKRSLTKEDIQAISDHASFGKMRERGRASYLTGDSSFWDESKLNFFRKGKKGDWRQYFTQEQSNHFDEEIREKCTPIGLAFTE